MVGSSITISSSRAAEHELASLFTMSDVEGMISVTVEEEFVADGSKFT